MRLSIRDGLCEADDLLVVTRDRSVKAVPRAEMLDAEREGCEGMDEALRDEPA